MLFRLRAGRASGSEAPTRVNTVGGGVRRGGNGRVRRLDAVVAAGGGRGKVKTASRRCRITPVSPVTVSRKRTSPVGWWGIAAGDGRGAASCGCRRLFRWRRAMVSPPCGGSRGPGAARACSSSVCTAGPVLVGTEARCHGGDSHTGCGVARELCCWCGDQPGRAATVGGGTHLVLSRPWPAASCVSAAVRIVSPPRHHRGVIVSTKSAPGGTGVHAVSLPDEEVALAVGRGSTLDRKSVV